MFSKFVERGLSVIPLKHKEKYPIINDWSVFSQRLPTQEEVERWDKLWESGACGIGLVLGSASNIMALDLDNPDNQELNDLAPISPVAKRGEKGLTRFFRPCPGLESRSPNGLDILWNGRQTVLPPSIHPKTNKPYLWITPDTLENFSANDLPVVDLTFVNEYVRLFEKRYPDLCKTDSRGVSVGRNNWLKSVVWAKRINKESEEDIVEAVYSMDLHRNTPRLFTDRTEGFLASDENDARMNAWKFVNNVTLSFIKKKAGEIAQPHQIQIIDDNKAIEKYIDKAYPEPSGLLKDIRDLIMEYSERAMPNIALGGAVALMAAICSNRFRFDQCWSNMYVLNLAPTGGGKSFPQKIISKILDENINSNIIGFGNYQSSAAFLKNLISRRERLDVIDEISSLFAQLKNGGLWQTSILEEMCKVWSCSSGKFSAAEYSEKEDTSSCFNPCINIFGSSTMEGIKPNITKLMVTKGLIPRFMIFKDESYGTRSLDKLNEELLKTVTKKVESILSIKKRIREDVASDIRFGPVYDPVDLSPMDRDAIDYFEYIKNDFFTRVELEESEPVKDLLTRGKEQTMKFAIIHAAGNFKPCIDSDDLLWAKQSFEACLHNSRSFIEETAVDNEWEKDVQSVLNLFNKYPFVTLSLATNRIRRLSNKKIQSVFEHLTTMEKIIPAQKESNNRKTNGWTKV